VESLEQLLNIARIKTPCDLDLLLFFVRHPHALNDQRTPRGNGGP
jgi:hypothetical protein